MEPQIRYARAEDGVNIAYYTLGSGPPFVWLSLPMTLAPRSLTTRPRSQQNAGSIATKRYIARVACSRA